MRAAALLCLGVSLSPEGLGVSWNTANTAVLAEGKRVLIEDPTRFDGVSVIGVDEHLWRPTRRGDKYVTVIIDLTPIREDTGPSRLLDMIEGRSKAVFKTWLADRPHPAELDKPLDLSCNQSQRQFFSFLLMEHGSKTCAVLERRGEGGVSPECVASLGIGDDDP